MRPLAKVYRNQQTNPISSVFICVHLWFQLLNSDGEQEVYGELY
jgi:hypothetical protein